MSLLAELVRAALEAAKGHNVDDLYNALENTMPDPATTAEVDPYANRKGNWFETFSGRPFFPSDPRPEEIFIVDIAHALGNVCRFAGHVPVFYSVAQHSLLVSLAVAPQAELDVLDSGAAIPGASATMKKAYADLVELGLVGLLHDAAEAYIGDMVSPVKSLNPELNGFRFIEAEIERAIRMRFLLSGASLVWDSVKTADRRMLFTEKRDLRDGVRVRASLPWEDVSVYPPYDNVVIRPLPPETAERLFLERFHDLWKRKDGSDWNEAP